MRIIEMNSDNENCEFKIVLFIDNCDIDIKYLKLFSTIEKQEFDKTKKFELTYHKKSATQPTKIHLKFDDGEYISLPLTELVNPNVNTEIPIPLFKITLREDTLKKKFKENDAHKVIDMKNNNIAKFYLTSADYITNNYSKKWDFLTRFLCLNPIEYYVTRSPQHIAYNLNIALNNCKKYGIPQTISTTTSVTQDIGILVNMINDVNVKDDKTSILFIENAVYMGILGSNGVITSKHKYERAFQVDLYNNKEYFDDKESDKWKEIFEKEFKKLDEKLIKNYKNSSLKGGTIMFG